MRWMPMLAAAVAMAGCTYERIYGPDPEERYEAAVAEIDELEREEREARALEGRVIELSRANSTITIHDSRSNETWVLTLDPSSSVYSATGERLGTKVLREGARVRASFDMMVDELRAQRFVLLEPAAESAAPAQPAPEPAPPPTPAD